jgi:hypothetical protein
MIISNIVTESPKKKPSKAKEESSTPVSDKSSGKEAIVDTEIPLRPKMKIVKSPSKAVQVSESPFLDLFLYDSQRDEIVYEEIKSKRDVKQEAPVEDDDEQVSQDFFTMSVPKKKEDVNVTSVVGNK